MTEPLQPDTDDTAKLTAAAAFLVSSVSAAQAGQLKVCMRNPDDQVEWGVVVLAYEDTADNTALVDLLEYVGHQIANGGGGVVAAVSTWLLERSDWNGGGGGG